MTTYHEKEQATYQALKSELEAVLPLTFTLSYDNDREMFDLSAIYKGVKFIFSRNYDKYLRMDSGYYRLPHINSRDSQEYGKLPPHNVKKLRTNAILKVLDYEVQKYNHMKEISEVRIDQREKSLQWLKDNNFEQWGNDSNQYRIYIPNVGMNFYNPINQIQAVINDSGKLWVNIITQRFNIDGDKDKTLAFFNDVQNLIEKYK